MLDFSPGFILAGLLVGFVVGLTGMGGGALMTPALVFFFNVNPLTAISSDVVTSLFMKPAGAIVHIARKTAHLGLVLWLCIGSVPAAFLGAVLVDRMRIYEGFEESLLTVLGAALLITSCGLIMRAWSTMLRYNSAAGEGPAEPQRPEVRVRRLITVLLGALGGLLVGLTSVGAGSLIITLLLLVYPTLKPSQLVGTDLVQAILLMASGLKLVGASTEWVLISSGAAIVLGPVIWALLRRRYRGTRAQQAVGQISESGGDAPQ